MPEVPVPGAPYDFGTLIAAQSIGDHQSLCWRTDGGSYGWRPPSWTQSDERDRMTRKGRAT